MCYGEMSVLLGQCLKPGRIAFRMSAVKIEPAANSIVIALIFAAVASLVSRHAMKDLHLDTRKEIRYPVPWHEGRVGTIIHNLLNGFQTSLIRPQRSRRTTSNKPRSLVATSTNLILQRAQDGV